MATASDGRYELSDELFRLYEMIYTSPEERNAKHASRIDESIQSASQMINKQSDVVAGTNEYESSKMATASGGLYELDDELFSLYEMIYKSPEERNAKYEARMDESTKIASSHSSQIINKQNDEVIGTDESKMIDPSDMCKEESTTNVLSDSTETIEEQAKEDGKKESMMIISFDSRETNAKQVENKNGKNAESSKEQGNDVEKNESTASSQVNIIEKYNKQISLYQTNRMKNAAARRIQFYCLRFVFKKYCRQQKLITTISETDTNDTNTNGN